MVAEEFREYQQARDYYQQALAIKIKYNDYYPQAKTYGQMGLLALATEDWESAKTNLLQALTIFAEFNDQHSVAITLRHLARFYTQTQDESLLTEVATIFNVTTTQVREGFEQINAQDE